MNRLIRSTLALALVAASGGAATAQEPARLTTDVAARLAAFHNRPTTTRLIGESRLGAGTRLEGDVALLGGSLIVEATVLGDVVVLNGDLELAASGRIEGDAIVVGGAFRGRREGVTGELTVYPEALRFRRADGLIVAAEPARAAPLGAGRTTRFGRTDFMLGLAGSYNRAEGLPIAFGPRIELGHSNPTVLDARLIYRTRTGLRVHPDEFGHRLRLEQHLGGHGAIAVGLSKHNSIDAIERNGVSDTENSLSTFVLHRDYRDHYGRRGWGAYLRVTGRARPFETGLEYLDERHGSVEPGSPWSLLNNDDPWRPQPQAAEGELRSVRGWLQWDTRNDRVEPSTGWLIRAEAEQGLEGELTVLAEAPGVPPEPPFPVVEQPVRAEYTTVRIDARRYLRLGPRTRVALRALFDGSPDDGALPPQRQHTLGGEGSLPGLDRFALDCGARSGGTNADGYFPYYGCDRRILAQAEMRFAILPGFSLGQRLGLDFDIVASPEVVLFADAGRAWIEPESLGYRRDTGPGGFAYDAGVGVKLGRIGLYLAVPLRGPDGDPNLFIRLGPRL